MDWPEIIKNFRGSELQGYFNKILEDKIIAKIKPQYVDNIPKTIRGQVSRVLQKKDGRKVSKELIKDLELTPLLDRKIADLSGGELQRFAICVVSIAKADIYMFDEPSSYLDVRQRLKAARVIRSLLPENPYVIVVEHDLAVIDYLSDFVCCLYGVPGAYGVVTMPFSVREGINIFLAGFVPTENLRFREISLSFKIAESVDETQEEIERKSICDYPEMTKTLGNFELSIESGDFCDSEIIVMVGENGTGKTTFIRMLAGLLIPNEGKAKIPKLNVSYKPQKISPKFQGTVQQLLDKKIQPALTNPQFITDVYKPLSLDYIKDQEVLTLSGGELQRVALCLALGTQADVYLIDEPSAYLDSEQRIIAAKVIKRHIIHSRKTGFIVEHDFIMATYLADRVIVFEGEPAIKCVARKPQGLLTGMNLFLKNLEITFRRDPTNYRPRINKFGSIKDKEQKANGTYFFIGDDDDAKNDK